MLLGCQIDTVGGFHFDPVGKCETDGLGRGEECGIEGSEVSEFGGCDMDVTFKVSDKHDDVFDQGPVEDWDVNKWEGELLFPWLDENVSTPNDTTHAVDMVHPYICPPGNYERNWYEFSWGLPNHFRNK